MNTKESLIKQLNILGVPKDKPVMVHTSLRAVGEIDGGAQTLLDALIEHVTSNGGLLVIPAHTWANFYELKKEITLDLSDFNTCVGTFPNIAVADKRGYRTLNPTHSVVVFGDKERVKAFVNNEDKMPTPTNPKGLHGKIFEMDGSVLLIGVGHNKNTILHCVEEILQTPNRLSKDYAKTFIKTADGELIERNCLYMKADGTDDVSQFFPKYEVAFRYHNAVKDGFIGNAKTQLCSANKMKDVMAMIFERSGKIELMTDDKPLEENWYK